MEKTFADIYPLMQVEQDRILSKQGDLTLGFLLHLPECFTLSDEDYENMHQTWLRAIRLLEPGTILHKQDHFRKAAYHAEAVANESWLNRSARNHFEGRALLNHDCYVWLTLSSKRRVRTTSLTSSLLGKNTLPPELLDEAWALHFEQVCLRFKNLLESSKLMRLERLKAAELLSQGRPGIIEQYCTLSYQKELPDIQFDPLKVGQNHLAIYALADAAELPAVCGARLDYEKYSTDQTRFPVSFAAHLGLLLACDHTYNQYIVIGDAQQTLKRLEKKRLRLQSLSAYSRANALALEDTHRFLNEAIGQQRLPVKGHFNVMCWASSERELQNVRNQVTAAFASIDASIRPETAGAPQLWWAGIPGNAAELPENDTYDTFAEQACCLFNLESNYRSDASGIRFCDRLSGRPVLADLYDAPRQAGITSNMGTLVCGTSGGGKSMTVNHILRSLYDQGAHCVTVDIGGSYQGLCSLVGGYYFTYSESDPIAFNPFYLAKGDVLDTEKKESLKALLVSLWKGENETYNRAEYVALSNALQGYYANLKGFPGFNSFYEYLQEEYRSVLDSHRVKERDFDMDNFLYVLRPYYRGGEFDYLLNATENLDLLSQPFIVFELDQIKDHPILFPVVTLIIMELFISKMRKLPGVRKVLTIDEAWKAIAKSGMAEFLRYAFKTIRKFNGIPNVVTQELDDLISSPIVKDAIINNADIKILMDMRKFQGKFDKLQDALGLSDKGKTILLSVNKDDREIFIDIGGQVMKVYRNELCPEEYFAYTTEGKERVRVQELAALHGSYEAGVEAIIKERRQL